MFIDRWIDEENMVYTCAMEYNSALKRTFCNIQQHGWPWIYYAEWIKSVTEQQILHDSISMR